MLKVGNSDDNWIYLIVKFITKYLIFEDSQYHTNKYTIHTT